MLDKLTQYGTFNSLAREFVTLPTATVQTRPANMSALVSSAAAGRFAACETPGISSPQVSSTKMSDVAFTSSAHRFYVS